VRRRSLARAIALQALYQFDLRGEEFANLLEHFLMEWSQDAETRDYARELIEGCRLALAELDAAITERAEHWELGRMAAVDRNVLRIGCYELKYGRDVPPKVAVDEAIRLAKRYSTEESSSFVNGVLDRIMKDVAGRSEGRS